jgi:hypothetical protein
VTINPDCESHARMSEPRPTTRLSKTDAWLAPIFIVAVGCRLAAARGELAFDEIWTWMLAARSKSALEILVGLSLDNNHILNTLVVYALGPNAEPLTYRLPAVAAASAGLVFGYLLGRRRGAGLPVLILLGASHLLILYGSEARGYAYLSGCTLGAWWVLEEYLDRPRTWCRAGFALACALGLLSQLPFAFAYAGFFTYSVLRLYRRRHWMQSVVLLHAWPVVAIVAIYVTYVVGLTKGGGDKFPLGETLVAALSLMVGGPQRGVAALVAAAVAALLLAVSLATEFRAERERAALYLTAMFAAPAGVIAISGFEYVYPRHFLVPMMFGYVAIGSQLANWFRHGQFWRFAAVALVWGYVAANAVPIARLIAYGRSPDAAALLWIVDHSEGPVVTISGDHDFRVGFPFPYHLFRNAAYLERSGKRLEYFALDDLAETAKYPRSGTDWKLRHTASEWDKPPPALFTDMYQNKYEQVKVFPTGSLSGFSWFIYRRK